MERRLVNERYLQDLLRASRRERLQSRVLVAEADKLIEQARAQCALYRPGAATTGMAAGMATRSTKDGSDDSPHPSSYLWWP